MNNMVVKIVFLLSLRNNNVCGEVCSILYLSCVVLSRSIFISVLVSTVTLVNDGAAVGQELIFLGWNINYN